MPPPPPKGKKPQERGGLAAVAAGFRLCYRGGVSALC